jgi:hypothetical protein
MLRRNHTRHEPCAGHAKPVDRHQRAHLPVHQPASGCCPPGRRDRPVELLHSRIRPVGWRQLPCLARMGSQLQYPADGLHSVCSIASFCLPSSVCRVRTPASQLRVRTFLRGGKTSEPACDRGFVPHHLATEEYLTKASWSDAVGIHRGMRWPTRRRSTALRDAAGGLVNQWPLVPCSDPGLSRLDVPRVVVVVGTGHITGLLKTNEIGSNFRSRHGRARLCKAESRDTQRGGGKSESCKVFRPD